MEKLKISKGTEVTIDGFTATLTADIDVEVDSLEAVAGALAMQSEGVFEKYVDGMQKEVEVLEDGKPVTKTKVFTPAGTSVLIDAEKKANGKKKKAKK